MDSWQCNECKTVFQLPRDPGDARCPGCGSASLTRFVTADDDLEIPSREYLKLKGKDPSRPSKQKVRREVKAGKRPEGSGSGRIVDEWVLREHNADIYEEKIVDEESGRVIRDVKEPLSQHRGGSENRKSDQRKDA